MTHDYLRIGDPRYTGPEPFAYRLQAFGYLTCARCAIEGHRSKHGREPVLWEKLPIMQLICHAAEMFLKLGLYKTGSDDNELKSLELRHNLRNLADKCKSRGVVFSNDLETLIDVLSPLHAEHAFRYRVFDDAPIPMPFTILEMIDLIEGLLSISHPSQTV